MTSKVRACVLVLASALLQSCIARPGPAPETFTYVIRRDASTDVTPPASNLPTLSLDSLEVAAHLKGIVTVQTDGLVQPFIYHGWAAPLSDMVGAWLRSRLRETGRWSLIYPASVVASADQRLSVWLDRFEIFEGDQGEIKALVSVEALLQSNDGTRTVLWAGWALGEEPVAAGSEVPALVQALSRALGKAADGLANALSQGS